MQAVAGQRLVRCLHGRLHQTNGVQAERGLTCQHVQSNAEDDQA